MILRTNSGNMILNILLINVVNQANKLMEIPNITYHYNRSDWNKFVLKTNDINFNKIEYLPNLFISSIFLTIAYIFSVLTIFYAPLSLTASSRYSVIVFGMIFGYLILNEIPSTNMVIGATIISLSGLFVIRRQKKLGKID